MSSLEDRRHEQNLKRLERRRELFNRRLDQSKERMNARFDQKQAELNGKLNSKQELIINAALELLSDGGLANISLREIAKKTNMQAPALYWYFKSKEDLVDYMAEAILDKEFKNLKVRKEDEPWQDWLINHMVQLRKAMRAFPDGARVVAGAHIYPAVSLAKSLEYSLTSLQSAGVELKKARSIIMTTTHYTFGHVIEEQASPTPEQLKSIDIFEMLKPYPHIVEALRTFSLNQQNADKDFVLGLKYIIAGGETVDN
jgi:TetR/AcrR family tetracycline transcriptional repressor